MTKTVGFVGLGTMGAPMAWNIRNAGFDLHVYNRSHAPAEPFRDAGVPVHATPGSLAQAVQTMVIMVTGPEALGDVVNGPDGLVHGLRPGSVVINMSTVSPEATLDAAQAVEAVQGQFVDAPVSGTRTPAEDGTLTVLAGADQDVLEQARPVLESMSKTIVHCGAVGQGTDMKHVVNLLLGAMMQAFSESLVLGRKRGLDPATMVEAITSGATDSPLYRLKGAAIQAGNFTSNFALELLLKDLDLVLQAGRHAGAYLPVAAATREAASAARARGHGDQDMAALIRLLEDIAGVEVRRADA